MKLDMGEALEVESWRLAGPNAGLTLVLHNSISELLWVPLVASVASGLRGAVCRIIRCGT